jgi:two-component sensor histidine kinase
LPAEDRYFDFSCVPLPGPAGAAAAAAQLLVVAIEVTAQQRAQEALRRTLRELEAAVAEKTVLLKEVHHRVKNNLAVIVSLLSMKASAIEGAEARAALEDSQHRVRSIALIHEHLCGTVHLYRIDFAEYARQLLQELRSVYGDAEGRIAIRLESGPIRMGIDRAVPCALILNELVINALKHAFPEGRRGEVLVGLRQAAPGEVEVSIEDNGVGCPPAGTTGSRQSLGLRIVEILTRQLEGSIERVPCAGTRFVLRFRSGSAGGVTESGEDEAVESG